MAFNCRESVGTGPVALKVVPVTGAGAAFSGFTMDQLMCTSLFPHLLLVNEVGIFFYGGGGGRAGSSATVSTLLTSFHIILILILLGGSFESPFSHLVDWLWIITLSCCHNRRHLTSPGFGLLNCPYSQYSHLNLWTCLLIEGLDAFILFFKLRLQY